MSITERLDKIKPWLWPINLVLVGTLAFGLGRWSKIEEAKTPVMIENPAGEVASVASKASLKASGLASTTTVVKTFVASKNGTKYYYPACSGVARIKEENKIWFSSAAAARGAGYSPAANCPGL